MDDLISRQAVLDLIADFLNCQCECEVQKDVGIACIHYEECAEESEE